MRYRGFEIVSTTEYDLVRRNQLTGEKETCKGHYCQIYDAEDVARNQMFDEFDLAVGHEIPDDTESSRLAGIAKYVDRNYDSLIDVKWDMQGNRISELLGRALCWISENESEEELYNTFLQFIEMAENPTCETEDRVFLLSADEVYEYFHDSADEEKCRQTQYARNLDNVDASYSSSDYCSWWLRSGFGSSDSAPNATRDNKLREVGTYTDNWHDEHPIFYGVCVRPAIIIKD